jgi:acetyl-CoA carboxylase biotin carboxyl carrier protein
VRSRVPSGGQTTERVTDHLLSVAGLTSGELSDLINLVAQSDIVELDVTVGSTRVSLRRPAVSQPASTPDGVSSLPGESPSLAITSPGVGIFRPAVSKGDEIQSGQSIGAIEALGMPTSVEAPRSGSVEEVLVQNGAAVEYGQPLLILRRASHVA